MRNSTDQRPVTDQGDAPLDPAAMLALASGQQRDVGLRLAKQIPWILVAWGIAWLVGFGLLWAIDGAPAALRVPLPIAVGVFIGLTAAAMVVSAVIGARANRGIRATPESAFTGTVYGVTGSIAFASMVVFGIALRANGMSDELTNIFFPVASALLIGFFYLMAAAIWQGRPMIVLGVWVILVGLVAPFFGYPTHYLVFAIAGGAGFLVSALVFAIAIRRARTGGRR